MKKKIKQIYYSEELPELIAGLCSFLHYTNKKAFYEFYKYYKDTNISYLGGYNKKGKWCPERLNLICLLIHSLELED